MSIDVIGDLHIELVQLETCLIEAQPRHVSAAQLRSAQLISAAQCRLSSAQLSSSSSQLLSPGICQLLSSARLVSVWHSNEPGTHAHFSCVGYFLWLCLRISHKLVITLQGVIVTLWVIWIWLVLITKQWETVLFWSFSLLGPSQVFGDNENSTWHRWSMLMQLPAESKPLRARHNVANSSEAPSLGWAYLQFGTLGLRFVTSLCDELVILDSHSSLTPKVWTFQFCSLLCRDDNTFNCITMICA